MLPQRLELGTSCFEVCCLIHSAIWEIILTNVDKSLRIFLLLEVLAIRYIDSSFLWRGDMYIQQDMFLILPRTLH